MNYLKNLNFVVFVKENNLLDTHKFWASHLYQKVSQPNLNLYQANFRKKHAFYQFAFFLSNQMNCKIIAGGKLGEEDGNFCHLCNISW